MVDLGAVAEIGGTFAIIDTDDARAGVVHEAVEHDRTGGAVAQSYWTS
jgi:hypothetical protein